MKIGDRFHRRSASFRWIVGVHVLLFGLIAFGFGEEYLRNQEIEAEIARMEAEYADLEAQRLSSLALIDTLSSSYYVESEARQRGRGEPGERLVIVQDDTTPATQDTARLHDDIPNPLRWYYYFFDRRQFDAMREESV
jgi:cell division protein FtsB